MESILISIKKMLGVGEDYTHFDADLIIHINSVFMILTQLGVGPTDGFVIRDASSIWGDFLNDSIKLEGVKSYMFMKVKLLFDPPASGTIVEAYNRAILEYEWRLNNSVDYNS